MKFRTEIPIRFRDLDALGHVNNAVFFTLIEQGRIAYFQNVIGKRHNWNTFGVLIAHNSIDYFAPIHLEDKVICGISVPAIGQKSIEVVFELYKQNEEGKQTLCAKGKNVLVCHDHVKGSTAPVPPEWREKFSAFEGL